jgi:hypothetical protein
MQVSTLEDYAFAQIVTYRCTSSSVPGLRIAKVAFAEFLRYPLAIFENVGPGSPSSERLLGNALLIINQIPGNSSGSVTFTCLHWQQRNDIAEKTLGRPNVERAAVIL